MFEFIGIVVITLVLAWVTCIPLGYFYMGHALGAWVPDWKETAFLLVLLAPCVVGWYFWWEHIGSKINVSFG